MLKQIGSNSRLVLQVQGTVSLAQIGRLAGCNGSSVLRHKRNHLQPAVRAELERIENGAMDRPLRPGERPDIRKGVRAVVAGLYEDCRAWMDRAKTEESWPMAAAFARESRQSAELYARPGPALICRSISSCRPSRQGSRARLLTSRCGDDQAPLLRCRASCETVCV